MAKKTGEVLGEFGLDRVPQKAGAGKRGENLKNKKKFKNKKIDPDETDGGFLDIEEGTDETNESQGSFQESKIFIDDSKKEEAQKEMNADLAKELEEANSSIDNQGVDRSFSRKAAKITLNKIDSYDKLNAETEKEGNEKFIEETKKILKNLVVHGRLEQNKDTGKIEVVNKTDLDCKAALCLLDMAGVDTEKVKYIAPGEIKKRSINIDTGNKEGLYILEDGTIIIDHHGEESENNTSATEKVFKILTSLGVLKDFNSLKNLVSFVNNVDNFKYPESYFKNYFTDSWKTLYGLSKMLDKNELRKFFEYRNGETGKYFDPKEPMDDELMKKIGLIRKIKDRKEGKEKEIDKSASHKEKVLYSKKQLESMAKEGFIIDSERYGKICLNIDGRVKCGKDAAKAFGCNTILNWNTNNNNFFISSLDGKKLEDNFEDGLNIRGTMWINPIDKERNIKLAEILNKMTDGKFEPSDKVSDFLEKEDENKSILEDLPQEEMHGANHEDLQMLEINEKIRRVDETMRSLSENFKKFILANNNSEDWEFTKKIRNEIDSIKDGILELKRIEKGESETKKGSKGELNLLNKLEADINKLLKDRNWEEELIAHKNEKTADKETESDFSPEEKEDMDKLVNFTAEFTKSNLENKSIWKHLSEIGKSEFLKALLVDVFEKKSIFSDKNEVEKQKTIEYILNNLNK